MQFPPSFPLSPCSDAKGPIRDRICSEHNPVDKGKSWHNVCAPNNLSHHPGYAHSQPARLYLLPFLLHSSHITVLSTQGCKTPANTWPSRKWVSIGRTLLGNGQWRQIVPFEYEKCCLLRMCENSTVGWPWGNWVRSRRKLKYQENSHLFSSVYFHH